MEPESPGRKFPEIGEVQCRFCRTDLNLVSFAPCEHRYICEPCLLFHGHNACAICGNNVQLYHMPDARMMKVNMFDNYTQCKHCQQIRQVAVPFPCLCMDSCIECLQDAVTHERNSGCPSCLVRVRTVRTPLTGQLLEASALKLDIVRNEQQEYPRVLQMTLVGRHRDARNRLYQKIMAACPNEYQTSLQTRFAANCTGRQPNKPNRQHIRLRNWNRNLTNQYPKELTEYRPNIVVVVYDPIMPANDPDPFQYFLTYYHRKNILGPTLFFLFQEHSDQMTVIDETQLNLNNNQGQASAVVMNGYRVVSKDEGGIQTGVMHMVDMHKTKISSGDGN